MKNDQWFQPGDKVMKVSSSKPSPRTMMCSDGAPNFGEVYCVEDFWEGPEFNVVMLVGFGGWRLDPRGQKVGWRAAYFRRVEEIKLCVQAVSNIKTNPLQTPARIPRM